MQFLFDHSMAQINRKSAAYTVRLPLQDFKMLQKAETIGLSYRDLTKKAVRHFIESGAIDQLQTQTEKAA